MTTTCKHCGEQIDAEDAKWFDINVNPLARQNFFPDFHFANMDSQNTVTKAESIPIHRAKGRAHHRR